MSVVLKTENDGMVGKIYKINQGYYFKITKNNKEVARMYYYSKDKDEAVDQMWQTFFILDKEKVEKL